MSFRTQYLGLFMGYCRLTLFVMAGFLAPLLPAAQGSIQQHPQYKGADPQIPKKDVIITLRQKTNWDVLRLPIDKVERGAFVYEQLQRASRQSQAGVQTFLEKHGIAYSRFSIVNAIRAQVPESLIPSIASLDEVAAVIPNAPFEQEFSSPEPALAKRSAEPEWGIVRVRADSVWSLGYRGQGVVVAGADTGFDWDHPALKRAYRGTTGDTAMHAYNWHDAIHEINPLNGDSIPDPSNNPCGLDSPVPCDDGGHGTHTMGTMVGEDGMNLIGVAPEAKWIACRNMERGWGSPATYLECMEWFLAPTDEQGQNPDPSKAPHVINNSWSCPEIEGCNPTNYELLRQAVVNLRAAGIVVVVSAGNSGSDCGSVETPLAIFEESFTVGAIRMNDTIAGFSSRGPVEVDSSFRIKPNVSAPGVQVRSSWIGDTYINASGTSMSGPHVAGVVALIISANPELAGQVEVIETILEETARPKTTNQDCGTVSGQEPVNNSYGHGIIDALAAVEAALLISPVVEEPKQSGSLLCFPNPARDQLIIQGNGDEMIHALKVLAPDGRVMVERKDITLPMTIGVENFPVGLYFIVADQQSPVLIHIAR